jgi:hypothetical protein
VRLDVLGPLECRYVAHTLRKVGVRHQGRTPGSAATLARGILGRAKVGSGGIRCAEGRGVMARCDVATARHSPRVSADRRRDTRFQRSMFRERSQNSEIRALLYYSPMDALAPAATRRSETATSIIGM